MIALGVIPARLHSTRFPKKILHKINSKPMVVHVYENAQKSNKLDDLVIAIDSEETKEALKDWNVKTIMTSKDHICGTDRVYEASKAYNADIIINIQADEPGLDYNLLNSLVSEFENNSIDIVTAAGRNMSNEKLKDENIVKVMLDKNDYAVDFYRNISDITKKFYHHMGIYAYAKNSLEKFVKLESTLREKELKLEQLRAIDNAMKIKVHLVDIATIGVDTPEDLKNLNSQL